MTTLNFEMDSYNSLMAAIKITIPKLNYEQQLNCLSAVISLMSKKNETNDYPKLSKEESKQLFKELTGCVKGDKEIDAKTEYLAYLDEKYGV